MADFNNAVMTNGGAALLAATTAGTAKIKFTKLVTGSGTYSDSEKTCRPALLSKLRNRRSRFLKLKWRPIPA